MCKTVSGIVNIIIIIIMMGGTVAALYLLLNSKNNYGETDVVTEAQHFTIPALVEYVKEAINDITRANLFELGLNEIEFKKQANKRAELKKALKCCMHGSIEDKQFVKSFIYDILSEYITDEYINKVIPFNNSYLLSPAMKFAIMLHMLKKEYGADALSVFIESNQLDLLKENQNKESCYIITAQEIEKIYDETGYVLRKEDKLEIITQAVYERYKGLGPIDEIRDMNIDGVSGGVSGITQGNYITDFSSMTLKAGSVPRNYESIWIFYKGKSIKLDFTGFESERELRRVCQIIYRYNRGGQLSETTGYRVNEMKDGSRVLVVRPPFSESWAFFVRKFPIKNVTLETLIQDENADIAINLIKFIVKGGMVTAVTGQQGSGKTTLLMAMVRHIYPSLTLRIQEMAFELNLRKLYPDRNILTFRETETISGQEGLDVQKKTDGSVNILGEIATDPVASWMVQMAQVASLFTLFTHHAKTTPDLIYSLRNSLLKCEMFNNEKIAEQQVISVLDFDIHLAKDYEGKRYIERITEIVEIQDKPYSCDFSEQKDICKKAGSFMETTAEYYRKMTEKRTFETKNIIEFKDGRYNAVNRPTEKRIIEMKKSMSKEDSLEFNRWLNENFSLEGRRIHEHIS
jgi:pilus assembly protein CpaF